MSVLNVAMLDVKRNDKIFYLILIGIIIFSSKNVLLWVY